MQAWTIHVKDPAKVVGLNHGKKIMLVTPEEFKALPNGTVLLDIFGTPHVKGRDEIDQDTRFGHLAFGLEAADA